MGSCMLYVCTIHKTGNLEKACATLLRLFAVHPNACGYSGTSSSIFIVYIYIQCWKKTIAISDCLPNCLFACEDYICVSISHNQGAPDHSCTMKEATSLSLLSPFRSFILSGLIKRDLTFFKIVPWYHCPAVSMGLYHWH